MRGRGTTGLRCKPGTEYVILLFPLAGVRTPSSARALVPPLLAVIVRYPPLTGDRW
jgi:hypothetical protein